MTSHSSQPDCACVRVIDEEGIQSYWTPARPGLTVTLIAQRFKESYLPSARVFYRLTRDSPEHEYLARPCPTHV